MKKKMMASQVMTNTEPEADDDALVDGDAHVGEGGGGHADGERFTVEPMQPANAPRSTSRARR